MQSNRSRDSQLVICACAAWMLSVYVQGGEPMREIVVGADAEFREQTEANIQRAVDALLTTGGRVIVSGGEYRMTRGISIARSQKPIEMVGRPGTRLVLEPSPCAKVLAAVAPGETAVKVDTVAGFFVGALVEFTVPIPEIKQALAARIAAIDNAGTITLNKPFTLQIPAGERMMVTQNMFDIVLSDDVTIRDFELDLQRDKQPFAPVNHTRHCGIFATGGYKYDDTAAKVSRRITVSGNRVRNTHHRGIAFYAVEDALIENNNVENTGGEAIDVDHFCRRVKVLNNTAKKGDMTGIELNDASQCLIEGNTVSGFTIGINIWHYIPCKMADANIENQVLGNLIADSRKAGIRLAKDVDRNIVRNNVIVGLTAAQAIQNAGKDNVVEENTVR